MRAKTARKARARSDPTPPEWSSLLEEAIVRPGVLSTAYSTFWNYSIGNELIALFECIRRGIPPGPIHTFKGWHRLGRHVKRGEKAIELCMPVSWVEKVDPSKYLQPGEKPEDHQQ